MIIKMCIKLLNLMPNSKLKTPTELKIKKHGLFDVINSIWLVNWIHVCAVLVLIIPCACRVGEKVTDKFR